MDVIAPECRDYHQDVFSDASDTDWCVLGYEGKKIVAVSKGSGGLAGLVEQFDDGSILYCFLRMVKTDDCGDSVRTKFVFLTWVGSQASPLKKGMVNGHKPSVAQLFKGFHIEKGIYDRNELRGLEDELETLLKKAGGANYDMGNTRSGITKDSKSGVSEYKKKTKEFFEQKERETTIAAVVYDKGPLREGLTPQDLSGRPMVAGAAQAHSNTVDQWSLHKSNGNSPQPKSAAPKAETRRQESYEEEPVRAEPAREEQEEQEQAYQQTEEQEYRQEEEQVQEQVAVEEEYQE